MFRRRGCGEEGTFVYDGRRDCPNCGSADVQLGIGIEELPDDHPFVEAMIRLSEETDEKNED